jgi:hypothetical protein
MTDSIPGLAGLLLALLAELLSDLRPFNGPLIHDLPLGVGEFGSNFLPEFTISISRVPLDVWAFRLILRPMVTSRTPTQQTKKR